MAEIRYQITPVKRIEDAIVVWPEETADADLIIGHFSQIFAKKGSADFIYVFNITKYVDAEDIPKILFGLRSILKTDGELYIIENDFEYILRAILSSEISIKDFNKEFLAKSYTNMESIAQYLKLAGFDLSSQRQWFEGGRIDKQHYEIIISAKKIED